MRVRQIDPEEIEAQRIDQLMLSRLKERGGAFEEELRRRLGGPSEHPVLQEEPPPPPALEESPTTDQIFGPEALRPLELWSEPNGNGFGPSSAEPTRNRSAQSPAERSGNGLDGHALEEVSPRPAGTRLPAMSRAGGRKSKHRSTNQWKKRAKARRR